MGFWKDLTGTTKVMPREETLIKEKLKEAADRAKVMEIEYPQVKPVAWVNRSVYMDWELRGVDSSVPNEFLIQVKARADLEGFKIPDGARLGDWVTVDTATMAADGYIDVKTADVKRSPDLITAANAAVTWWGQLFIYLLVSVNDAFVDMGEPDGDFRYYTGYNDWDATEPDPTVGGIAWFFYDPSKEDDSKPEWTYHLRDYGTKVEGYYMINARTKFANGIIASARQQYTLEQINSWRGNGKQEEEA